MVRALAFGAGDPRFKSRRGEKFFLLKPKFSYFQIRTITAKFRETLHIFKFLTYISDHLRILVKSVFSDLRISAIIRIYMLLQTFLRDSPMLAVFQKLNLVVICLQLISGNFSNALSVCTSESARLFTWFNFSEFQVT